MINTCKGSGHVIRPLQLIDVIERVKRGCREEAGGWRGNSVCLCVGGGGDSEAAGPSWLRCGKWERAYRGREVHGSAFKVLAFPLHCKLSPELFSTASLVSVFSIFMALLIKHQYERPLRRAAGCAALQSLAPH